MSILSKIVGNLGDIKPDIHVEVDPERFAIVTTTHIPGIGDYEHVTECEDMYDMFVARMQEEGYI